MYSRKITLSVIMMLATQAQCFIISFPSFTLALNSQRFTSTRMFLKISKEDLSGKEFQLEELEDRDESETELWLNADGTVTLGKTNGPMFRDYRGDWHVIETASESDNPFRMRLLRTYEAGSRLGPNDVGEFAYEVKREFHGSVEMVGESISVSGKTHGLDERDLLDCEVGYFTVIDAAASEGIEGEKQ